jgi:putative serine protease PepD
MTDHGWTDGQRPEDHRQEQRPEDQTQPLSADPTDAFASPSLGHERPVHHDPTPPSQPAGGPAWPTVPLAGPGQGSYAPPPYGQTPYPGMPGPPGPPVHPAYGQGALNAPHRQPGVAWPHRTRAALVGGLVAGGLLIALLAGLVGGVVGGYVATHRGGGDLPGPGIAASTRPDGSIANIAAKALPSVVTLKVRGRTEAGTGSGFILRQDGYILTNNHVVALAGRQGRVTVEFSNGKELPATVVGGDASYDLAVVKVDRTGLPVLRLGRSSEVAVGDSVIAVGAPLGLESTVTSGIVSALNRPVSTAGDSSDRSFINAIQTDAAINPGNSGGPLLDTSGQVIGINSAIAQVPGTALGGQSGNIGVGFAIPSDQARKTAEQLIRTGSAQHPVIGVTLDMRYDGAGAKVVAAGTGGQPAVVKGGPADKAGIRPGDVIIAVDGRRVGSAEELIVAIRAKSVGDVVTLTVRSGGRERTAKMTLEGTSD